MIRTAIRTAIIETALYIWQLPQNLLGLIVIFVIDARKDSWEGVMYYNGSLRGAVSLGRYIIIDRRHYNDLNTLKHEYGHQRQSKYLGWLYLIVVGLPSAIRNLIWRTSYGKTHDYYKSFPENWADKLGGIRR